MYFYFKTTDKMGVENLVDIRGSYFCKTDEPAPDKFNRINVEDFADLFCEDPQTPGLLIPAGIGGGWESLPFKTYDSKENKFLPFDPYTCEAFQNWFRRDRTLRLQMQPQLKPWTEFKKLRRALLAVLDFISDKDLEANQDIKAFRAYSDKVQSFIDADPKGAKHGNDLRKSNEGKEPKKSDTKISKE